MKMEQKFYTPQGFKALQDELDHLINVRVEENKKEISKARAYGDLSENSEYDAAKQEQAIIHARIDELREMIANAKVFDESQIDESKVSVGSIVVLFNVERNREFTYHIVGSYETDPENGKIFICHADCIDDVHRIEEMIKTRHNNNVDMVVYTGSVIGAHSGPGTIAIFYLAKER